MLTGSSPFLSVKSFARDRYSYWISSALISRPFASRTRLRPVMSWLTSRIARIGLSRVMSLRTTPASTMRSTRSVAPTLSSIVVSLMLESPTMTCSRRNLSASPSGSSLVLMIGRDLVVADDTPSQMCSARWLTQYTAPRGVASTFPAPQISCLVTRNGVRMSVSRPSSWLLRDQVVLVAAVGIARRVGVVLEQVNVPGDAFLAQPLVGVHLQALEDPLPRLVVRDEVKDVVALRCRVLRMAAHVEVEPRSVPQEDVAAAAP